MTTQPLAAGTRAEATETRDLELRRSTLLLDRNGYTSVKDPCPVFDGARWHLFGTGVLPGDHRFEILHATAPRPAGPWRLRRPARVHGVSGGCVAAPGVVVDGPTMHMFLQTEYNVLDGIVEHAVSVDGGATFQRQGTVLRSLPGTDEAGIYDPHPAEIHGTKYLVYSGFSRVGRPDIYLARSRTGRWSGPYERVGMLMSHDDVPFHNRHDDPAYEWGLEGAQLLELPDGRVLLVAVCFLGGADRGNRQRVFFAIADSVAGPYRIYDPALHPANGTGENGHAAGVVHDGELHVFFQERAGWDAEWSYGLVSASLAGGSSPDDDLDDPSDVRTAS